MKRICTLFLAFTLACPPLHAHNEKKKTNWPMAIVGIIAITLAIGYTLIFATDPVANYLKQTLGSSEEPLPPVQKQPARPSNATPPPASSSDSASCDSDEFAPVSLKQSDFEAPEDNTFGFSPPPWEEQ